VWLTFDGDSWHFGSCLWVVANVGEGERGDSCRVSKLVNEVVVCCTADDLGLDPAAPPRLRHHQFSSCGADKPSWISCDCGAFFAFGMPLLLIYYEVVVFSMLQVVWKNKLVNP
jgi:hypothetical protein